MPPARASQCLQPFGRTTADFLIFCPCCALRLPHASLLPLPFHTPLPSATCRQGSTSSSTARSAQVVRETGLQLGFLHNPRPCAQNRTRARTATQGLARARGRSDRARCSPGSASGDERGIPLTSHFIVLLPASPRDASRDRAPAVNCSFEPSTARCWRWAVRARGCLIVLELARAHLTLDATLSAHVHPGRAKRQPHRSCNPCNIAVRMSQACSEPVRTLSLSVRKRSGGSWTLPDTPIQPRAESSFCEAPLAGSSREGARDGTSRLVPLQSAPRPARRLRSKKWIYNTFKRRCA